MIADPLTKAMSCDRLSKMLSTGILDLNPTQESLIIKAKSKLLRKKAKEAKKPKDDSEDAENEDIDLNVAWRSEEDDEDITSKNRNKDKEDNSALFKAILEMELGEIRAKEFERKTIEYMRELKKKKDSDIAKKKEMEKKKGESNGSYRFQ